MSVDGDGDDEDSLSETPVLSVSSVSLDGRTGRPERHAHRGTLTRAGLERGASIKSCGPSLVCNDRDMIRG
jgi:hypothetical protein